MNEVNKFYLEERLKLISEKCLELWEINNDPNYRELYADINTIRAYLHGIKEE